MASLETLIAENTAALNANTKVVQLLLETRIEVGDAVKAAGAKATAPKAEPKAAAKAEPKAEKANISTSPEDRKDPAEDEAAALAAKKTAFAEAPMGLAIVDFLGDATDAADLKARKDKIDGMLVKLQVKKMYDIPAEHEDLVLDFITKTREKMAPKKAVSLLDD